ncbi:hypothetical protein Vafri_13411 [Volvox africanus]|nr:hypothetical protein Vafri_13411 [Volvox africanus]
MGSWSARHVMATTAADLQQARAADAAADEAEQLPQLQPRFFHSQSGSKLQPPPQHEEMLVDGHTVGYILSADALVLGSGCRGPLAAEEKVEAMWLSTTGMQHRHQQQLQAEPRHQQGRGEQTHQSPHQRASPLITQELANQRLQRAQQWSPGAPVKHTASGPMATGTTAISSPSAGTRLRCDKATSAATGTTTTGEIARGRTDATTAGHHTAATGAAAAPSALALTMAAATVAAVAGAAPAVEDAAGNHGAILERIPAAAPSFCSGTSVEGEVWSWSAATCSHNPSLLQLTASAPPPPSPSPQHQKSSSAAALRGAIGSPPPATETTAGPHTATVAPSPAVAMPLPAVASLTTAKARPLWWQGASTPREHAQHTEPCPGPQQPGLIQLAVEDRKPNTATETNPAARQAKWMWRPSFRSEVRLGHITASKRDVSGAGSASGGFTNIEASTTGGGASTKLRQGLKATTRAPDLHALAAVSSATYKRATEQHTSKLVMDAVLGRPSDSDLDLDSSSEPPSETLPAQGPSCLQPRILDTFADQEALDSPVLILGSSCFIQLAHLIGAIRSAPPVGYGKSFRTRTMVIIADSAEDGKVALSSNQLATLGSLPGALPDRIFVLRADPRDAADLEKLNLKQGCSVAAVLVPSKEQFAKGGVKGAAPALADGQLLVAAAALRRYCDQMGCRLRVVAEVLALLNCSYALPLCLEEGPYHTNSLTGTQRLHSYRRPASSPMEDPDAMGSACNHAKFVTDPRPDFRRGVRMTLGRLRRLPDQVLQEEFVQEMLSQKPHLTPSLAPGHILMETFMDALACQSIFNPMILQILLKMLNCWTVTPTHHRRVRLQNHHPHHHSHQQQQQQPFQHQHQHQHQHQNQHEKQARRFHFRQQSHPHITYHYSRYLQLRHQQRPQAPQRPPQVSPSPRRKERPARSITRGVPVVASPSSAAVVASFPHAAAPSSPALFPEGRPEPTQVPLVASPHPRAAASSTDYVSGSILNPVRATGCQSIPISLAAPTGPAVGTANWPGLARLITSESPQTQSPPPPSPSATLEPVKVTVPPSLRQSSHDEVTGAVKASTRGPACLSRRVGSGIGLSRQSAIAAASAAILKDTGRTEEHVCIPTVSESAIVSGTGVTESANAATMIVVVKDPECSTRAHACANGPGQRTPGPLAECTEKVPVPESSPPPSPPRQSTRDLTDREQDGDMPHLADFCEQRNCNRVHDSEDSAHGSVHNSGGDGQRETGVSVSPVPAAVAEAAGTHANSTMGFKNTSGAADAKSSATAADTVRLFSLNYREMLRGMPGLRELLHSAQESQQLQQQQQLRNPNSSSKNVGSTWSWSGMVDPATSVHSHREAPKLLQLHPPDPSCAISFGVLFEVLVDEYDMMPLALYRRDVGNAADVSESDKPRNSGGVRTSCPSAAAAQLPLGLDGGTTRGTENLAAVREGEQIRACRSAPGVGTAPGLPYVYTKPNKYDTWLRYSDDVYLLASQAVVMRFWNVSHP